MMPHHEADVDQILAGQSVEVAPRLLGCVLETSFGGVTTSVRLTEVEAYGGQDDPASHAYRGQTARNRSMFLGAGHMYVYLSYGVHMMANVVTGPRGDPGAVLLRAGEPLSGIEVMEQRRGRSIDLCNGPGKLAQALGFDMTHDGVRLGRGEASLSPGNAPREIRTTPRVGITKATERNWRFLAG